MSEGTRQMGKVVVINHVTLDGVLQGPGRPDEDTRDGFDRGGWAASNDDEVLGAKLGEWMNGEHAFLFGRWTYENLLEGWNRTDGPYKDALNNTRKYVASRRPDTTLDWPNSTLLSGDIQAAVSEVKETSTANQVMMGSGELIGDRRRGSRYVKASFTIWNTQNPATAI